MSTDTRTVPFEELAYADLYVGAVYLGGAKGNAADDPLAKLLPVGNQGGFRHAGSPTKGTVRLSVLYTSGVEKEWPDELDMETGVFTYFGDNRKPGRNLLNTTRGGNILLRDAFTAARGAATDRLLVPLFLLFEKAGRGRAVRFVGLLAPGEPTSSAENDLTVVRHRLSGQEFENYRARFTVLDTQVVRRSWLTAVLSGDSTTNAECPDAWRVWVGQSTRGRPAPSRASGNGRSYTPGSANSSGGDNAAHDGTPGSFGGGIAPASEPHPAGGDLPRHEDPSRRTDGSRRAELLDALHRLSVHRQDGKAAFYQYVVLLWAISRTSAARLTPFSAARESLNGLLAPFALTRSTPDPAMPWIALADSPWWEIDLPDADHRRGLRPRDVVRRFDPEAGLSVEAHALVSEDEKFRQEAVAAIAEIGSAHPALDGLLETLSLRVGDETPVRGHVASSASVEAVGEDRRSAADLSAACVTSIPPEVCTTETFERERPSLVVAERRESALQDRYLRFLEAQGHRVCRQMVVLPGESNRLYTDLFDVTTGELIEVKSDSGRATIRLALGQILDYARHITHTTKAVLVPDEPAADLVDLLQSWGIAVVWEAAPGVFQRKDPL